MLQSILQLIFKNLKPVLHKGLIKWENVMGHDTVETKDMKEQVELLQNENEMESN